MIRITMGDIDNIVEELERTWPLLIGGMIALQAFTTLEHIPNIEDHVDLLGTIVADHVGDDRVSDTLFTVLKESIIVALREHPQMELEKD